MTVLTPVLAVHDPGPLALVQDLGRPGFAALGVSPSGAADRGALRLANRLVGNDEGAAGLELTLGGLDLSADAPVLLALTGAVVPVLEPTGPGLNHAFTLPSGVRLRLGAPTIGMRSYLAVRGGLDEPVTLGSRSTDLRAALGPDRVCSGRRLPVGVPTGRVPAVDVAPVAAPLDGTVELHVRWGPRDDWFTPAARAAFTATPWQVGAHLDRTGVRLVGGRLERRVRAELPSEGMVRGAVQVPPDGEPIVFLADHPSTGGYPVIAVVLDDDADGVAQLRPDQRVRFLP